MTTLEGVNGHTWEYVSEKTLENFIEDFIEDSKIKNELSIKITKKFFQNTCTYFENSGLFIERHRKEEHSSFSFLIFFPESSTQWWENLFKKLDAWDSSSFPYGSLPYYYTTGLDAFRTPVWQGDENEFTFDDDFLSQKVRYAHELHGILPKYRLWYHTGSTEIHNDDFYDAKNFALHIEGWDDQDPPMVFFTFGEEELPPTRFSNDLGKGCTINIHQNEGKLVKITIFQEGNGYYVKDILKIITPEGTGGLLKVEDVGPNGEVIELSIVEIGDGYIECYNQETLTCGWLCSPGHIHDAHPKLFL